MSETRKCRSVAKPEPGRAALTEMLVFTGPSLTLAVTRLPVAWLRCTPGDREYRACLRLYLGERQLMPEHIAVSTGRSNPLFEPRSC
jgi:hypothetical protein